MPVSPLFSTYRAGENRVTSSLIAVLERIDLHLVERILSAAIGEATLTLLTFANQATSRHSVAITVPDASVSANLRWLFEMKTERNALARAQLRGHLQHLDGSHADERLIVITPDPQEPELIGQLREPRVSWASFAGLSDAIDVVLSDPTVLAGDRTVFLLRELQALFRADGLLDHNDVVVVAARNAYPEYLQCAAYICQPGRGFQPGLTHLGFYTDGQIKPEIPRILGIYDAVTFNTETAEQLGASRNAAEIRVGELIRWALAERRRVPEQTHKVFLLTPVDSLDTVRLTHPIQNTTVAASGRAWAWTLGQRYTRLSALQRSPATTDELAAGETQASADA